ncbi:MAG: hypothetical protein WBE50_15525, partial [Methyloceanibacter sp.]
CSDLRFEPIHSLFRPKGNRIIASKVQQSQAVSGDGICNNRTDMKVHKPPARNKPAAAVAHSKRAVVVERHTPLAV